MFDFTSFTFALRLLRSIDSPPASKNHYHRLIAQRDHLATDIEGGISVIRLDRSRKRTESAMTVPDFTMGQKKLPQVSVSELPEYDVLIIGAGLSGIYSLIKMRQLGLRTRVLEAGSAEGGTWFW